MTDSNSDSVIICDQAPEPVGPYPHARRVGNLIFVSGMGPRTRGRKEIPGVIMDDAGKVIDHDIVEQSRSVFANIRTILEHAGARWEDIVDVTVFLTHIERDFAAFNRVYGEHFKSPLPARTTVEVTALPTSIAVELKVIAAIPT